MISAPKYLTFEMSMMMYRIVRISDQFNRPFTSCRLHLTGTQQEINCENFSFNFQ